MYSIITNAKGSRSIEVSDSHLATLEKYNLLADLVDSAGMVTEEVLEKLRLHVRSLLEHTSDSALVELCQQVLFHNNMKAIGLQNLMTLASEHSQNTPDESTAEE